MHLLGSETIRDIIDSLDKPESYVRGVLGSMFNYRQTIAEPIVAIGVTGKGIVPHYRLQPASNGEDVLESVTDYWNNVAAFNGRNHKQMEWDASQIKGDNWSGGRMTLGEVQALLGDLRGYNGRRL